MIVNQANLHGLTVGYSTAFNKSFDTTQSNYQKVATVVPSTTGEQDYKWLGQMPGMREWIGEREIQALAAYDYLIKNKKFEMTIGVPRDDIEDDKYGVYTPLFSNMGEAAAPHPEDPAQIRNPVVRAHCAGFRSPATESLRFQRGDFLRISRLQKIFALFDWCCLPLFGRQSSLNRGVCRGGFVPFGGKRYPKPLARAVVGFCASHLSRTHPSRCG